MSFGNRLKLLRKKNDYSQEKLAEEVGVSRQAVCKWETDKGYPETDTLILISEIFHVTVDYLLKGENQQESDQTGFFVSEEMIEGYQNYQKNLAKRISIGVSCICISSMSFFVLKEEFANILQGLLVLIGFALIIWQIFIPNQYKELEQENVFFHEIAIKKFKESYPFNRRYCTYGLLIAMALLLVGSPVLELLEEYGIDKLFTECLYFLIVACVIGLFIYCGLMLRSQSYIMKIIMKTDKDGQKINYEKCYTKRSIIYRALPFIVLATIVGWLFNAWSPVFPVIVFIAILLYDLSKKREECRYENK